MASPSTTFLLVSSRVTLSPPSGGSIREVTFSPDGRHVLAVVGESREVVWETDTGRLVFASRPAEGAAVTRLAMSPSSTVIALGREDGKVEMRTSDDGQQWPPLDVRSPHRDGISWIDFDSQSQQMVSTSRDGVAVVWDTATGKIAAGPENFGGRGGSTTFFQPGSATSLVNVASNGLTWKWEPPHGGLLTTVSGCQSGRDGLGLTARPACWFPAQMEHWSTTWSTQRRDRFTSILTARIRGIAASGDGKRFVVVHTNGSLELRDAASGALVSSFDQQVEVIGINQGARNANAADYTVRLDILIALDRGGTRVAFQAGDHRIYIVDDHGSSVKTVNLSSHRLDLQSLALSEDGSEVVASTRAGEALWYDVDGSDEKIIAPPGAGFDGQFVSGDRVAVVGRRGVQFIDPRSTETTSLALGVDATRVAVDSSGRLLATAGATGSIQLWDAQFVARIGEPLKLRNLSSPVPMRFSADGHHLVVSEAEETTWVDVWFADWPDLACNLVKEKLSPEVRARYGESLKASELCP